MSGTRQDVLRSTPLADAHHGLGARMGAFAGWEMPIRYPAGIIAEHHYTRQHVSVFDICHMGEIRATGPSVATALDSVFPRRVSDQSVGTCRYNFLLNERGGVIDDLLVYRIDIDEFLLVVNAGTIATDVDWLREHLSDDVCLVDESPETGKLDLQGPEAFDVLATVGINRDAIPSYYRWDRFELFGHRVLLSRTGYTGERGVEIYASIQAIKEIWQGLLACDPVEPAGLGARDTLRLEVGYPLYGHELDQETTPCEAGFGGLLDLEGRTFVGRSGLLAPPRKKLVGFRLAGRRAARAGDCVWSSADRPCGTVTSGAFSPSLGTAIAMGYIETGSTPEDVPLTLGPTAEKALAAEIVKPPFYREGTVRMG